MSGRKVKLPAHRKVKTPSNYDKYKKEVLRLIDKAGIGGAWEITIRPRLYRLEDQNIAECVFSYRDRWAIFGFDHKKYKADILDIPPERLAKHEVGHLLTARLSGLSEDRFISRQELDEANEEFARIMERML